MLDDGRLTDGKGRTVDFKNTVVIMTSNLGRGEADVMDAVRKHLRPEFINRIDEIIDFHPLDRVHMKATPSWWTPESTAWLSKSSRQLRPRRPDGGGSRQTASDQ